ncbi:DNA topoisomerase IV subunit A [Mycoplasmopsis californica HAZ160_1]|uniref:DNA gyrase subunit A n=1 Tax=Mycoplasmopsis californica HAZ160_1 TaxID=1397850 RepID=A0AAT9F8I9_9BACT|nr:DNA gyrase subunit A [Mycoplasmopsis californica]BAP01146.1 DNA topoisomerase IV subunit A [Mycoplasmopsis californica HAZ160_1]BBG41012.1 DNA topoisomerase IV subunit A [Mycoplasmopsis californica]BBG41605.1 DNA topoisomerase IV subunit A [Mycoplasmopsis californica]BBG42199.1 DNA topoisomerase IV subunit A [Mycoplasmopsis californica]BBG42781.1 DNA topoisomerase IV subunit A [Mycoplasmopsis californica]
MPKEKDLEKKSLEKELDTLGTEELNEEFLPEEELFVAFKNETAQTETNDDEEEIPQNKEDYVVQSQIIDAPQEGLHPVQIDKEMKNSFLEYAMSVIVARALPDARDGLKPVHRRILFDMSELGITHNSQHRKSARIVGDVLGKYHPHGDSSVYEAMVRMAQDFSMRYPLVDGHGNFGSIDGDGAAAMRYTEARMSKVASEMLEGIKKDTVDFVDNYDASEKEPVVLPSRFPNLLVTGGSGIAVGMATNIPPHNLGEAIDATIAVAKNPDITIDEIMHHMPGPDFPTGAIIVGNSGIKDAYSTGRGSITIRSVARVEEFANGRSRIIVTEIPYEIKKTAIIEKIAELVKDKVIEGISDLRDETNREGIRIVIDVKRNINPHVLLNKLYRQTNLQVNYGVNFVALVDGEPKLLNVKQAIEVYLKHQEEVVTRRLKFDLEKAKDKLHVLEGLKIAVENIDEVIAIIKKSKNDAEAQKSLGERFSLSERQTKAIVDMRLGRLTGLAIENMITEMNTLIAEIQYIESILADRDKLIELIISELKEIKEKYSDSRRSQINLELGAKITDEDLIPQRNVVITTSTKGYVKRIDLNEYKLQRRGGVGITTMKTYEDDDVASLVTCSTHTDLLLFSNHARVYRIRAHEVPEMSRQSKGVPFINLVPSLNVKENEKIISILPIDDYDSSRYLFTSTKHGIIKKTKLSEYSTIHASGKYAFKLQDDDELVRAMIIDEEAIVILANNNDRVVKFLSSDFRPLSRTATGVKGINLGEDEEVISASSNNEGDYVLTIGALGYGKLTHHDEFRLVKRGAKGVIGIKASSAGKIVFSRFVNQDDELLIITSGGLTIRIPVSQISEIGRNSKGVKIINLKNNEHIKGVEVIKNNAEIGEKSTENTEINTHN